MAYLKGGAKIKNMYMHKMFFYIFINNKTSYDKMEIKDLIMKSDLQYQEIQKYFYTSSHTPFIDLIMHLIAP